MYDIFPLFWPNLAKSSLAGKSRSDARMLEKARMTVIIYASCYQRNEGSRPPPPILKEISFQTHFAPRGLPFPSCMKFDEFVFFFQTCPRILFLSIEDFSFFYEMKWILSSWRLEFPFYFTFNRIKRWRVRIYMFQQGNTYEQHTSRSTRWTKNRSSNINCT